jgi:plastocyanin
MKMTRSHLHKLPVLAAVGVLALMLAACGSSSSSSNSTSQGTGGNTGPGTNIGVALKDFSISLDQMPSAPGTYTFNVTNQGPSSHDLTIEGPGVDNQTTGVFASGDGTKTLTVTLKSGSYDFFCSVPGHKAAGMNVDVRIGSGSTADSTGGSSSGGSSSSGGGWS